MKTNYGLRQWALDWVGMPYWYGTVCYECTESLLKRKKAQYPKHYTESRMARYQSDIKNGRWAADCIGLAKGYMWWDSEKKSAKYASNGCPDSSANGMLEAAKEKGAIDTLPEIPGLMLWMSGHAGIYIGDGWVIEERGFNYGCVKTRLSARPWKKWYKLPGVTYLAADNGEGKETAPFKTGKEEKEVQNEDAAGACVRITGNQVNVRRGDSTEYAVVDTLNRGDELEWVATAENGWHAVRFKGEVVWVSGEYGERVEQLVAGD